MAIINIRKPAPVWFQYLRTGHSQILPGLPKMCIRHYIHRMYCDKRSFVGIAQETSLGRITKTYVSPYEPPQKCEHDHLKSAKSCSFHGCCWVKKIDLPCDCADKPSCKSWGLGANEDITQCRHFRDYHEYVYKTTPLIEAKKKCASLVEPNVQKKPWDNMKMPYLDSWVTSRTDVPADFFCDDTNFRLWRLHVIHRGETLHAVMTRQSSAWNDCVSEEEWRDIEQDIERAWDDVNKVQSQGWEWHPVKAKALLGIHVATTSTE